MEGSVPGGRWKTAGNLLIVGGVFLVAAVPFTVTLLVVFDPWFQAFFLGPPVLWPVIGVLAEGYLGVRAIRDGQAARAGAPPASHGTILRGYLGAVGAGLLLGGLSAFLGGVLLIVAGLTLSREEGAMMAELTLRTDTDSGDR